MTTMNQPPASVAEVASELGVSVQILQRQIRSGKIQAHKMPGRTGAYLIERTEVDRLRAQRNDLRRSRTGVSV